MASGSIGAPPLVVTESSADDSPLQFRGRPLEEWIGLLETPEQQWFAWEAVRFHGPRAAPYVGKLASLLRSKDVGTRRSAVMVLGYVGRAARPYVRNLLALIDDDDQSTREMCAVSLARIAPTDRRVARALHERLEHVGQLAVEWAREPPKPRKTAPPKAPSGAKVWISADHPNNELLRVLEALGIMGPAARASIPTLKQLAEEGLSPKMCVYIHAALARVEPNEPRHLAKIVTALKSPQERARYAAVNSLYSSEVKLSGTALKSVEESLAAEDPISRWMAACVVARSDPGHRRAASVLTQALMRSGGEVFCKACECLAEMDAVPDLTVQLLANMERLEDPFQRRAAVEASTRIRQRQKRPIRPRPSLNPSNSPETAESPPHSAECF